MAHFEIGCNKWQKLTDFNGQVTDATGKVIRKFKKGELKRSELSSSFAEDFYSLYLDYTPPSYPITIEFNWVSEGNSGNFGFPAFAPVEAYNTQVEHASYVLTAPSDMACRHLCCNTTAQVTQSTSNDGRIRYEAHMDNLPAIDKEVRDEAIGALTMLGFSPAPTQKVVVAILQEQPALPVEQVVKLALKQIK